MLCTGRIPCPELPGDVAARPVSEHEPKRLQDRHEAEDDAGGAARRGPEDETK